MMCNGYVSADPTLHAMTGADVDDRDCKGLTPLRAAAFYGRVDVARLLLDRGMNGLVTGAVPAHHGSRVLQARR
jgi:hypothetical protein